VVRKFRKQIPKLLLAAIAVSLIAWWFYSRKADYTALADIPQYNDVDTQSILAGEDIKSRLEPSYLKYVKQLKSEGKQDTENVNIVIPGADYVEVSDFGVSKQDSIGDRTGTALIQTDENSWAEYTLDIPRDGFYQIGMTYYAMPGKRASILRSLQIDGKYPFFQAKMIDFKRMWREVGEPWKDNQGNEFNPRQEELMGWQFQKFHDAESKVSEPLRFYLTQGKHTIRLTVIREPAAIGEIHVFSPDKLPTYADVHNQDLQQGRQESKDKLLKFQAEQAVLKSDPTLRRQEDRNPASEPYDSNKSVLNVFGGSGWRKGGQWAEWEIDVPASGLYNIGARYSNLYLNGIPVQRKVSIDGKIPFAEMNAVSFEYGSSWQIAGFGGKEQPYEFYLEQGKHRIRMEMQIGSLGEVFEIVQQVTQHMSLLQREIYLVTGTNPDPNRDYELKKSIPNLIPRLNLMAKDLQDGMKLLYSLGVEQNSSQVSTLGMARDQLLDMAKKPETITARLDQFSDKQAELGTWMTSLTGQGLLLDYFIVKSPDQPWPDANTGWAAQSWNSVNDFLLSFRKDYDGIGNRYGEQDKVLDVWVARGREWANIIKRMTDEEFTPQTGIKVNINVIPAGAMHLLMLSSTAGMAPDVALGVQAEIPIDYAVRNAVVNLGEFPDYNEIAARFRPGALIPYQFNNGHYALPENQNFSMLFYRKDILQQLGVEKAPETWLDIMDLIPLLQQNGMDFYYGHAPDDFTPFLFQNSGEYYRENSKYSALDTPEALKAMKMWTDLFTNYKINKKADFYNRFRTGEMPIGIADYSTYILLSTAAPELTGWWEMKPMPGIMDKDGQINRSTGGAAQTAVIFKDTKMKNEAWDYLKWWTSADVQEQFGSELESVLGVEARWNTANVEALKRLPWSSQDIDSVLKQWDWFKEREIVLGAYFTTRHITNMWNEIVLNGKTVREAVEDGIKEINKELRKKREEFGLDVGEQEGNGKGGGSR